MRKGKIQNFKIIQDFESSYEYIILTLIHIKKYIQTEVEAWAPPIQSHSALC